MTREEMSRVCQVCGAVIMGVSASAEADLCELCAPVVCRR